MPTPAEHYAMADECLTEAAEARASDPANWAPDERHQEVMELTAFAQVHALLANAPGPPETHRRLTAEEVGVPEATAYIGDDGQWHEVRPS